jgi:hypothetical protein
MNAQQKSFAEQLKELVEKYGDVEDFFAYDENRIGCRYANLTLHREEDGWHCGQLPEAYPTPAECYGHWWEGGV